MNIMKWNYLFIAVETKLDAIVVIRIYVEHEND